ncbi:MAG: hypothetical protein WCK31_04340, partial [bacterium]
TISVMFKVLLATIKNSLNLSGADLQTIIWMSGYASTIISNMIIRQKLLSATRKRFNKAIKNIELNPTIRSAKSTIISNLAEYARNYTYNPMLGDDRSNSNGVMDFALIVIVEAILIKTPINIVDGIRLAVLKMRGRNAEKTALESKIDELGLKEFYIKMGLPEKEAIKLVVEENTGSTIVNAFSPISYSINNQIKMLDSETRHIYLSSYEFDRLISDNQKLSMDSFLRESISFIYKDYIRCKYNYPQITPISFIRAKHPELVNYEDFAKQISPVFPSLIRYRIIKTEYDQLIK